MLKEIFGGNRNELTEINNPFQKNCITGIDINFYRGIFDEDRKYFRGYVKFKNGCTNGQQDFEGENLYDVFIKIAKFCENLN